MVASTKPNRCYTNRLLLSKRDNPITVQPQIDATSALPQIAEASFLPQIEAAASASNRRSLCLASNRSRLRLKSQQHDASALIMSSEDLLYLSIGEKLGFQIYCCHVAPPKRKKVAAAADEGRRRREDVEIRKKYSCNCEEDEGIDLPDIDEGLGVKDCRHIQIFLF